jgi:putative ABC transport system substrate-binding protein
MRRREFIALLGGAASAGLPLAAYAQQRVPRIGVLLVGGPEILGEFPQGLRELGYIEGKNIIVERLSAGGNADRLPGFADELVRRKVDIIVAAQAPSVTAAKNATRDIPIVMAPGGEPVALGFVASLARPGGNITGVATLGAEMGVKSLELVPDVVPTARRVGIFVNAKDPFHKHFLDSLQSGGAKARLEVRPVMVQDVNELDEKFAAAARDKFDAVVMQASLPVKLAAELALKHRLPSFATNQGAAKAGHLASYTASAAERGRQIAGYIDRILKGVKPSDLPVQQQSKFELSINLQTARALGLTVPATLLGRADEVIE